MNADRRKIKEIEVMVADVVYETPDTCTLKLFTGNEPLEYKAGHFLTIAPQQFPALERWIAYLEHMKGKKEPPRAYSMSSAPHEKHLAITVKEERYVAGITPYPPLLSPILALRTTVGARMVITGFTGPYTLADDIESKTNHVLHVCAGSGVVPSYSIIKDSLATGRPLRHTLLYSNKTWEDTIFARQFLKLQAKYPGQFCVTFTLTRQNGPSARDCDIVAGRVTKELLAKHIEDASHQYVYVCGPGISTHERRIAKGTSVKPRFLESVVEHLQSLGFAPERIKQESYG
jgi:ferredoxin-NADP reductase